MSYWIESVSQAMDAAGITYTSQQAEEVANDIEGAAGVQREYTGENLISDPRDTEIAATKALLAMALNGNTCPHCHGTGATPRGYTCFRCAGKGRVL